MLHKSFKPVKCKTSLKLAVSRIKLLKNKRDLQIKQFKRELAQLLESGQVQTARIRVEHVIREQNTLTAYDLIEIYCELIAQRMPIIESQKNCPIDLKEAISSVIFASPRCADIPELVDIRKHLAAKYGKEFVSAALELRPDCGVNRLMVEKLSAKAPEGHTKIKILNTIAEEHNIKWDPDVFAEKDSKPPEDLLNGPNTFQMPRKVHMDPPTGPSQPIHEDNRPPIIQVPPKHDAGTDPMQHKCWSSGDSNTFSLERQNWNMPFKDVTSAAQAAAFSAEQASIAARAAAELSRQYSSEPQRSFGHVSKDEMPHMYDSFEPQGDHVNEVAHIVDEEQDDLHERFLRLKATTLGIDKDRSVDDVQPVDRFPQRNSSEPTISDRSCEVSEKIQPWKSEVTSERDIQDGVRSEEITYFDDQRTRKRSDKVSSYSHSSSFSDEYEDVPKKNEHITDFGNKRTGEQSNVDSSRFIGNVFQGNLNGKYPLADDEGSMNEINYHKNTTVIFDDSGSDDDNYIDMESHTGNKLYSYFSPSNEKSSIDVLANSNIFNARKDTDDVLQKRTSQSHVSLEQHSPPMVSESSRGSTVSLQHESLPVVFDDSDAEEDSDKSKLVSSAGFDEFPNRKKVDIRSSEQMQSLSHDIAQSSSEDEMVGSRRKPLLPSSVRSDKASHSERSQGFKYIPEFEKKFDYGDFPSSQSHQGPTKSGSGLNVVNNMHSTELSDTEEDTVLAGKSSLASGKELNLGSLTGGLRNKGYRYPPYCRKLSGSSLSFKQATGDTFNKIEQPSSPNVRNSFCSLADSQQVHDQKESINPDKKISARTGATHVDSNNYHLKEKPQKQTSSYSLEPFEINNRASSRVPVTYFDSDNSDYEEDLRKMTSSKVGRPGTTELSRRTKTTSSSGKTHTKTAVLAEVDQTPQFIRESKSPPVSSASTEILPKVSSKIRSSDDSRGQGRLAFVEHGTSKQAPESRRSSFKESPTSFTSDHASDFHQRTPISGASETSKSTVLTGQTSIKDKLSHVHPKLPDYDSLAAHFQSLRQGR